MAMTTTMAMTMTMMMIITTMTTSTIMVSPYVFVNMIGKGLRQREARPKSLTVYTQRTLIVAPTHSVALYTPTYICIRPHAHAPAASWLPPPGPQRIASASSFVVASPLYASPCGVLQTRQQPHADHPPNTLPAYSLHTSTHTCHTPSLHDLQHLPS